MVRVELELHEAMVVAMVRRRRFTIPAQELADAVCEDGTYLRGDKKPPPRSQILARAGNKSYRKLFAVTGPRGARIVTLRCPKGSIQ